MCHVLIIEDEPLLAFDLQDMLSTAGATSFAFAETEDEAVAEARERRPDVITSDVMLREGTGPRAVETILRELGPVPVMYITASPDQCELCEPSAPILSKPVIDGARLRGVPHARADPLLIVRRPPPPARRAAEVPRCW